MFKENELISYLPPVVSEIVKVSELMSILQVEVDGLWVDLDGVLKSQYVNFADELAVMRYERMLGILPKSGADLSQRRDDILSVLAIGLPYTLANLQLMLKNICGDNGVIVEVYPDEYLLYVRVDLAVREKYDMVFDLVSRMKPANLVLDISLGYNKHGDLVGLTHGGMVDMTYYDVKNQILEVADV